MTTIRTFPIIARGGPQTLTNPIKSQSYVVPSGFTGDIVLQLDIPTADFENEGNSVVLTIDERVAGVWGATPQELRWQGGRYIGRGDVVNPPPRKILQGPVWAGRELRMSLVVPVQMQLGGKVMTEP